MKLKMSTQLLLADSEDCWVVGQNRRKSSKHHVGTVDVVAVQGRPFENLEGRQFGHWTVLGSPRRYGKCKLFWLCQCVCGLKRWVNGGNLRSGKTDSCGCKVKTCATHGRSKTKEYQLWTAMKMRCYNPKNIAWPDYGGRGITVCKRWRNSFSNFLKNMGERPTDKHSLDRINNDGNYTPFNCRWATKKEQAQNTRTTVFYRDNKEFISRLISKGIMTTGQRITQFGLSKLKKMGI